MTIHLSGLLLLSNQIVNDVYKQVLALHMFLGGVKIVKNKFMMSRFSHIPKKKKFVISDLAGQYLPLHSVELLYQLRLNSIRVMLPFDGCKTV